VIAPDYPLGPEATYEEIFDSIKDFVLWYKHDLFLETSERPFKTWTEWLAKKAKVARIQPDKAPIYISGESAGGHAAVTTIFLNADKELDIKLPLKVALLRFRMLKHYKRSFSEDKTSSFMADLLTEQRTKDQAQKVEGEIWLL
jgi:acetyl esterase/lipase